MNFLGGMMHGLGINIGSSGIKAVLLDGDKMIFHKVIEHEGDFFFFF
jgi:predicted NBD/HSP70 family sugar kinase